MAADVWRAPERVLLVGRPQSASEVAGGCCEFADCSSAGARFGRLWRDPPHGHGVRVEWSVLVAPPQPATRSNWGLVGAHVESPAPARRRPSFTAGGSPVPAHNGPRPTVAARAVAILAVSPGYSFAAANEWLWSGARGPLPRSPRPPRAPAIASALAPARRRGARGRRTPLLTEEVERTGSVPMNCELVSSAMTGRLRHRLLEHQRRGHRRSASRC